jgi:hypothetical protein
MARLLWSSALFLSVLQVSVSKPIVKRWDDFQVKHSWEDVPRGWELVGPAPADYNLRMKIGLKQDRMHELIDHLYQVSDPAHNRYVSPSCQVVAVAQLLLQIWGTPYQGRGRCSCLSSF